MDPGPVNTVVLEAEAPGPGAAAEDTGGGRGLRVEGSWVVGVGGPGRRMQAHAPARGVLRGPEGTAWGEGVAGPGPGGGTRARGLRSAGAGAGQGVGPGVGQEDGDLMAQVLRAREEEQEAWLKDAQPPGEDLQKHLLLVSQEEVSRGWGWDGSRHREAGS